jgi:hypothetical protein
MPRRGGVVLVVFRARGRDAALDRHVVPDGRNRLIEPRRTVDNEELGPSQTARDEIIEDDAPGLGALAAHAFDYFAQNSRITAKSKGKPRGRPFVPGQSGNPGGRPKDVHGIRQLSLDEGEASVATLVDVREALA